MRRPECPRQVHSRRLVDEKGFSSSSGSFAVLAAIRLVAGDRRPGSSS
jgi:hypothetical protein